MATHIGKQLAEVLTSLEACGSEKVRAMRARHGAGENQFGVLLGELRRMAQELGRNHGLALQLWATGNADAMILATMLLEPELMSAKEAERMLEPLTDVRLVDELVHNALATAPCAESLWSRWIESPRALTARTGWNLLIAKVLAGETEGVDLDAVLARIEAGMLSAPKLAQESMNRCLVEIGVRVPEYRQRCIAIGERLGRFDGRPVPKGCTSQYAPEWIAAALELRRAAADRRKTPAAGKRK